VNGAQPMCCFLSRFDEWMTIRNGCGVQRRVGVGRAESERLFD
jgi:hypothetical protein